MKKRFSLALLFLCIFALTSCSESSAFEYICKQFDEMQLALGGNVVIYTSESSDSEDVLISLYGREGMLPDELEMIDYAVIWYSGKMECKDAAIFHLTNATDETSVIKMCSRRAATLKAAVGIDMEIYSNGHFVCTYTKTGEDLEGMIRSIITAAD